MRSCNTKKKQKTLLSETGKKEEIVWIFTYIVRAVCNCGGFITSFSENSDTNSFTTMKNESSHVLIVSGGSLDSTQCENRLA